MRLPVTRSSSPHHASTFPLGPTIRIPRVAWRGCISRRRNICGRVRSGRAAMADATRSALACSCASMPAISRPTRCISRSTCEADRSAKLRLTRAATTNVTASMAATPIRNKAAVATMRSRARTNAAIASNSTMADVAGRWSCAKRQIAVASATAIEETTRPNRLLLARGPDGEDGPAVILVVQSNVKLATFGLAGVLNRPGALDLILRFRAELARALLLESAWMHASEEPVQQVGSLIAAVGIRAALLDQPRKLQDHLVSIADSRDHRLRLTTSEAACQIRKRGVEVLVLR